MTCRGQIAWVIASVVASGRPASAGGGPPTDAYDGVGAGSIDVHALADLYIAANFDAPSSHESQLREFDTTANEPAIGWVRLQVARTPRPFGFLVNLGAGDMAKAFFAADPASIDHPTLSHWLSHVGQAFATVVLPRMIAIDVGKFDTPVGLEDNENPANWNYSRSFVFAWDEPSVHTGARATCALRPDLAVAAFWLNGWNANILDGSTMRSYALAARYKPTDSLETVLVYAGGLERTPMDPALSFRNLVDGYVTYEVIHALSFAATADYTPQFWGVAGYGRYAPVPWLAAALRGERFSDSGLATGTKQVLAEVTATLETRWLVHGTTLIGRLDYRHDRSTADVFEHGTELGRAQDTLTLGVIASY